MKPTEGGRICGACDKKIVDFSKMSWKAIEQLQRQQNNAICGMYNLQQLVYWGQEIPGKFLSFRKVAVTKGLAVSTLIWMQ